ncbi:uncharacterized protein BDR25DRAFT_74779 [Lindgomyces ingoldianus]|uniref:Uncharacterized protein n=1 Tax=Lindgomyces ingoldianus TaxID=673940 RepID=A0ACB6QII4_9PLEO|nr:uncharacterized protein BDR25DRAFT_74779 [Lindgomyces ingoldianus]KAF2466764.1 hypothetical protein BDR25DRAFT_74779 [Lindgomyces ingoldianus]
MLFSTTITFLTGLGLSGLATAAPTSNPPTPNTLEARGRYAQAASLATWEQGCYSKAQHDVTVPDGTCYHLPNDWMTLWWLNDGCTVRLFEGENCSLSWYSVRRDNENQCIDIRRRFSYQVYC